MSLKDKAHQMRNALDAIELALHGDNDLEWMRELFEDAQDDVVVRVEMTARNLRQICVALDECNRLMHSGEFTPSSL